MANIWTERQFVGGALALDFANTVCFRADPMRRFDKLKDWNDLSDFVAAAGRHGGSGSAYRIACGAGAESMALAYHLELREAVDDLLRAAALGIAPPTGDLRRILRFHHDLIAGIPLRAGAHGLELGTAKPLPFAAAVTQSVLVIAHSEALIRLKVCPNCHWLFIDASRNATRVWCDMATCGNRAKAERHRRRRAAFHEPARAGMEV
ncbi:CGNR zinc finger domain-containing protein [Faunimonas sp. B44]|uniref:CGNR zinc finger domain-containing protein n=1 Tax=Faunimonas sp. B44 TaxID=3461493 RepID=UPI0040443860